MTMTTTRSYSEMLAFHTFEERFEYLSLKAKIGEQTFGFERWMNQTFYRSKEWRDLRHEIIVRDGGNDLGVEGFEIPQRPIIHHIIPMTVEDLEDGNPLCLDPENLITTTHNTHNAIHWGDKSLLRLPPVERRPGDTKLWGHVPRRR
jgi:hypothetical protein